MGVSNNEYADDTTFTFETREDYELLTPLIVKLLARRGLEVHVGSNGTKSKSVVLFCAKNHRCYTNPTNYDGANFSPISWEGGFHIAVVDKFIYIGSYLTINGRDDFDVESRIASVGSAFGALRKMHFLFL